MPRRQEYRGNPEHKRYELFENFTGGVNTTASDEMMYSNEFRDLENVELIEEGIVQNRKGFGYNNVLNIIMEPFLSILESARKVILFKILNDNFNIMSKIKESTDINDFLLKVGDNQYKVDLIVLLERNGSTELYKLTISEKFSWEIVDNPGVSVPVCNYYPPYPTDGDQENDYCYISSGSHTTYYQYKSQENMLSHTLLKKWSGATITYNNIVSLPVVDFNDKFYFSLNNISKDLEGIFEYNGSTGDIKIIDGLSSNSYVPNPYEVSNVGFNSFLDNPLDMRADNIGVSEIRGMYLTESDNPSLMFRHIPGDGNFDLHLIVKNIAPSEIVLKAYVEETSGNKRYLDADFVIKNSVEPVYTYNANIRVDGINQIFIEAAKLENLEPFTYFDLAFDDTASMVAFFTTGRVNYAVQKSVKSFQLFEPSGLTYGFSPISLAATSALQHKWPYFENWSGFTIPVLNDHVGEIPLVYDNDIKVTNPYKENGQHALRRIFTLNNSTQTAFDSSENKVTYTHNKDVITLSDEEAKQLISDYLKSTGVYQDNLQVRIRYTILGNQFYSNKYFVTDIPDQNFELGYIYADSSGNLSDVRFTAEPATIDKFMGTEVYTTQIIESEFSLKTPTSGYVYKVGTGETATYYEYNGGVSGTIADFNEISEQIISQETIISYINFYNITKEDEDIIEIETIDKKDIKLTHINNRLVLYKGNTMWFSDLYNFSYYPNFNYVTLSLDTNDSIQKIAYFRGQHIIFTKERLYRMSGAFGTDDFRILLISDEIGCISPDSVRSINNTLIFLARDGLYTIKQSFYMEALENVDKIDKQIKNIIPYGQNYESLLYNEQYLLLLKNPSGSYMKTVKQYYNMSYSKNRFPYTIDTYAMEPDFITKIGSDLYSIKDGLVYTYDTAYTDFLHPDVIEEEKVNHMYKCVILTPNYSLGYPTHDKKAKNFFIKTDSFVSIPLYITVFVNGLVWRTSHEFAAIRNNLGEIEYREILGREDIMTTENAESNLVLADTALEDITTIDTDLTLGFVELGEMKLGVERDQLHKVLTSAKGKNFALRIVQKTDDYFAIKQIGLVYKLGKVKESR